MPSGSGVRGSLALRHVDAGSCNGCEHELGAAANPYYDMQQYGLNVVASPRHADVLLVTGPVTTRMATALQAAYAAMPEPRLVAALGDCALGCGVLGDSAELAAPLEDAAAGDDPHPGLPADAASDRRAPARGARRANLTPPSPSGVEWPW